MLAELEQYRNCLSHKAFYPEKVVRISLNPNYQDPDLILTNPQNPYLLDQTKIFSSKADRRLSDKTQVFYSPDHPHIRTRSTHTKEVFSIGVVASDFLGLNTNLIGAQTCGHDIGHPPGGHAFEQTIKDLGLPEFRHERFGPIVAAFIERRGNGLNLTRETLKGIYEHSRGKGNLSLDPYSLEESRVTMYSDKIAYVSSDINDLYFRGSYFSEADYQLINSFLPGNQRERVNKCLSALIQESGELCSVSFQQSETADKFSQVKKILYTYYPKVNDPKLEEMIKRTYDGLDKIPQLQRYDITMFLALMTDHELKRASDILSGRRLSIDDLTNFSVSEVIETGFLEGQTYADLDQRIYNLVYNESVA